MSVSAPGEFEWPSQRPDTEVVRHHVQARAPARGPGDAGERTRFAKNGWLREYIEDRLTNKVRRPDGIPVANRRQMVCATHRPATVGLFRFRHVVTGGHGVRIPSLPGNVTTTLVVGGLDLQCRVTDSITVGEQLASEIKDFMVIGFRSDHQVH